MNPEIRALHDAMERHGYVADPAIATALFLAREMRQARCSSRATPGGGKTEIAKVLARLLGHRAHPAPVLRGARRQHGALRVELPAPDAARCGWPEDEGRSATRHRGAHLRPRLPARAAAAARDHAPTRARPSCSSTRSTAPTTASRRSSSRCCPTSRSRSPSSGRSAPSTCPTSSSRPTAPARSATRCAAAASTSTSSTRASRRRSGSSAPACRSRASAWRAQIGRFMQALRGRRLLKVPGRGRDDRLGAGARSPATGPQLDAGRRGRDAGLPAQGPARPRGAGAGGDWALVAGAREETSAPVTRRRSLHLARFAGLLRAARRGASPSATRSTPRGADAGGSARSRGGAPGAADRAQDPAPRLGGLRRRLRRVLDRTLGRAALRRARPPAAAIPKARPVGRHEERERHRTASPPRKRRTAASEGDQPGYSPQALLRRKPFEECTADELAILERLLAQLAPGSR